MNFLPLGRIKNVFEPIKLHFCKFIMLKRCPEWKQENLHVQYHSAHKSMNLYMQNHIIIVCCSSLARYFQINVSPCCLFYRLYVSARFYVAMEEINCCFWLKACLRSTLHLIACTSQTVLSVFPLPLIMEIRLINVVLSFLVDLHTKCWNLVQL